MRHRKYSLAIGLTAMAGFFLWPAMAKAGLPREGNRDISYARKVDEFVYNKLKEEQLVPAKRTKDSEFLRRLSLDLTGTIPPAEEVVAFINNKDRKKRAKKIDEFLNHPMFAENLAMLWANLLITRDGGDADRALMEKYLKDSFLYNKPYDEMVRDLLTAEGLSDENPAVNYLVRRSGSAPELAGHSARVFMGLQIQCAQCHNHPYEKWTQDDFWGFAAYFSGISKREMGMRGDKFRPFLLRDSGGGKARFQVRGKPGSGVSAEEIYKEINKPMFLQMKLPAKAGGRWVDQMAKTLTHPRNALFAKSIVNRVWYHIMGRGLVMPIDDLGENNPATHPELLEDLADDFIDKGYDLKYVYRMLCNTKTYQRSSAPRNRKYEGSDFYAYANMKPMTPEQLFKATVQATGLDGKQRYSNPKRIRDWMMRTIRPFVFNFGNDEEEVVEEFQGTIPQALLMMNGQLVNEGIKVSKGGNLDRLFKIRKSDSDRVELMFLAALSRRPAAAEKSEILAYIKRKGTAAQKRKEGYEDAFWALLNTTEFLFNH